MQRLIPSIAATVLISVFQVSPAQVLKSLPILVHVKEDDSHAEGKQGMDAHDDAFGYLAEETGLIFLVPFLCAWPVWASAQPPLILLSQVKK